MTDQTPTLRPWMAWVELLPEPAQSLVRQSFEEADREHWRAQFLDFGDETCDTCRRARLRDSFVGDSDYVEVRP